MDHMIFSIQNLLPQRLWLSLRRQGSSENQQREERGADIQVPYRVAYDSWWLDGEEAK